MKRNLNRMLSIIAVLALLLTVSAAATYASDDVVELPHFSDGRINEFDIDAPVAIYALFDYPYADDVDMGVLNRLEFWGYDYTGDETIEQVLVVTAEQIRTADNSDGSALVARAGGYALYLEPDDSLTLVAPSTPDGNAYQFNWEIDFSS